jgi:hypothetical protein
MMRTFVVLCALAAAGCDTTGTTAKVDALPSELQKSIAEYRACVDANGKRAKACEAQRLSMEAEERAYFNRSSGTQGGSAPALPTKCATSIGGGCNAVTVRGDVGGQCEDRFAQRVLVQNGAFRMSPLGRYR